MLLIQEERDHLKEEAKRLENSTTELEGEVEQLKKERDEQCMQIKKYGATENKIKEILIAEELPGENLVEELKTLIANYNIENMLANLVELFPPEETEGIAEVQDLMEFIKRKLSTSQPQEHPNAEAAQKEAESMKREMEELKRSVVL
eukprot:TRINITY_DN8853_c0_g1_i6.p2 TRINITY_DN8853_c0_g1~~TRINITY_DN8853_c0_g1_i6.p2  ORF type:complete len:148 (-),score=40.18 TRINITY_DN8853_c0_g1_i6:276-719(-)